jgi:hypothetical protein
MHLVMGMLPHHFPIASKPPPATTGQFPLHPLPFVRGKKKEDSALEFEKRQGVKCRSSDSGE